MVFDDPQNALSVARTHQRDLLLQEQRDRLGQQARLARSGSKSRKISSWWQVPRLVGWWLKTRISKDASAQARKMRHLPEEHA